MDETREGRTVFFPGQNSGRRRDTRVWLQSISINDQAANAALAALAAEDAKKAQAAIRIQKSFRGRKDVRLKRNEVRDKFYAVYGQRCEKVDRECFGPQSPFLRDLLFFYCPWKDSDTLVRACHLLLKFAKDSRCILDLFGGPDYSLKEGWLQESVEKGVKLGDPVNYRMKKLAYTCIQAVNHNKCCLKVQREIADILLIAVSLLIFPKRPWSWSCKIVSYLLQRNIYRIFKEIVIKGKASVGSASLTETVLSVFISHTGQGGCACQHIDQQWSFHAILEIPLLWHFFPSIKEKYVSGGLCLHHLEKLATCTTSFESLFPVVILPDYLVYVSLLGNLLEALGVVTNWNNRLDIMATLPMFTNGSAFDWKRALGCFSIFYKDILQNVDNKEFCMLEGLSIQKEIKYMADVLKRALWQIMCPPLVPPMKVTQDSLDLLKFTISALISFGYKVSGDLWLTANELASMNRLEFQKWLDKRQGEYPMGRQGDGDNDRFVSEAVKENTEAHQKLKKAPFLVPFPTRLQIYTSQLDAMKGFRNHSNSTGVMIRRDHLLEDAFREIQSLPEGALRGVIEVTYINFGEREAGIDLGGLFKDFMENVTRAAFDPSYGLFKETVDHRLYPNPESRGADELRRFKLLGIILGKAIFEGIAVGIPFASFFLRKVKRMHNTFNDLRSYDPEIHRSLTSLTTYTDNEWAELDTCFEFKEQELIPNGRNIKVTRNNVDRYIHSCANLCVNTQINEQSSHFSQGFQQLIPINLMDMFDATELQSQISGSEEGFKSIVLRTNTVYGGGYDDNHHVIEMFWEILESFSLEDQKKFLQFVTGNSRAPVQGIQHLEHPFTIHRVSGGSRLPTASACFNLLKLPEYERKDKMKEKLLLAMDEGVAGGFNLG